MKKLALLVFCIALSLGSVWAQASLTTNPAVINQDSIDWCANFGCYNDYTAFPTPQPWTSTGGVTGTIGLNGGFQSFYNLQEGSTWSGQFANNEGIIYNGALFGNSPTGIVSTFDNGVFAAGAYIQSDYYGPFTAYITLFDMNSNIIAAFWANGNSGYGPGTALFIGALSSIPIYAVQYDVVDSYGLDTVAIGTEWINTSNVPEPGTLVLFGSSVLGLAGYVRRRLL